MENLDRITQIFFSRISIARKKHSCHNGLKLLPTPFLVLFGILSSKSRKTIIPALRAQKSCSNSTKN
jgi:hypothetical protein